MTATLTNASTHNRVCCVALKCHREGVVQVRRIVDSATRKAKTTGEPVPVEVVLDYCLIHTPEAS